MKKLKKYKDHFFDILIFACYLCTSRFAVRGEGMVTMASCSWQQQQQQQQPAVAM